MPIYIPTNFDQKLPIILSQTYKWSQTYNTNEKYQMQNTLTLYSPQNAYPETYIILLPGLATNTHIDPLMQLISYWALTHKYNLFHINTFINIPHKQIFPESIRAQNWQEYINAINYAFSIIQQTTQRNGYKCAIGHSAGANGLISALNQNTHQNIKNDLSSVMLFAPFVKGAWFKTLIEFSKNNHPSETNPDIIYIYNLFNNIPGTKFVVPEKFFKELTDQPFEPEIMNKWDIKTTLIAGEYDKKAPIEDLRQKCATLKSMSNGHNFKFVEIPRTKHNFLNLKNNKLSILELLKSQRQK